MDGSKTIEFNIKDIAFIGCTGKGKRGGTKTYVESLSMFLQENLGGVGKQASLCIM